VPGFTGDDFILRRRRGRHVTAIMAVIAIMTIVAITIMALISVVRLRPAV
jgi:hypothetical protein